MFHRVSPQAEQDQKETAEKTAETPEVAQEQKQPEKQPEATQETEQKTSTPENTTTQKDTKDMNENAKDQTEDAQTEEQAQGSSFDKTTSAYQRPGQAPVQQATPYATSYAPTSSYASAPAEAAATSSGERTLTIGPGITMSGEIEACDYLLVEGTVEAALKGASMLEISETGTFYGTVEIDEANVAGRFEGDITVNGRLTIRAGGVITGSIAYKELEVESGAIIDGRLTPVTSQPAKAAQPAAAKSQPAADALKKAKEQDPAPANTDGELFSSKTAS